MRKPRFPLSPLPSAPRRTGFAEQQINEAMERGEFDNLSGKGAPLKRVGDLSKLDEMRRKLREDDTAYTAPWVEVGREIEVATRNAGLKLRRAWEFRRAGVEASQVAAPRRALPLKKSGAVSRPNLPKIESDFAAEVRAVAQAIEGVNSLILKHNLLLPPPLPHLYRARLTLEILAREWAPEMLEREKDGAI